jgi:antitoxin (DNA-binding transcriptional repressor) of toxin-antitoxin stability system
LPDLHPDLAAYTDAAPREDGTAVTAAQLFAHLLTDDPTRSLDRLHYLLAAADRGHTCEAADHRELAARLAGAERRYRDLLTTLVTVAATRPTTAAEALAEHTATTPPPSGAYKPNPVACDPTCLAALAGHPDPGPHHSPSCLNYRNPRFRGPHADRVIVDDPPPRKLLCPTCHSPGGRLRLADTTICTDPWHGPTAPAPPTGLADPDTECDCPDRFRSTVGPNDHHGSCAFTKHVLSTPNDPRSPDLTRHRHPATGETVYTIPTLPKDTP